MPKYKDVFLSYTNDDIHIANDLQKQLKENGISFFLSGNDIEVSVEWKHRFIVTF